MKYILMMQFSIGDWQAGNIGTWSPEAVAANRAFLKQFQEDLTETGEFVATQGLGGPESLAIVRAKTDGLPAITDGPFPESKEFLAGFWIVEVTNRDRAVALAARLSALPGPRGTSANLPIEIRPVMEYRSEDW